MSDTTVTPPAAEGTRPEAPKPAPPATAPSESGSTGPVQLPDDHPLVKSLAAQKAEIKALKDAADSGKTDAERTAERLAEVEKRATDAEARATRRDIALEHKLSKDDAALLDSLTDEEAMKALAARLATAQVEDSTTRPPKPDQNQGRSGAAPTSTADLFAVTVGDLIH